MYIREYMHTDVITTTSDTPIHDAEKIMRDRNIRRLPVVDKGKLVGIVTRGRIREATAPKATSLSVWELNYLLSKMKVRDVMTKDVITIPPDMPLEKAVALGQEKGMGAFPVMDGNRLVGIVTDTDLYKVAAHVLGFGQPGLRLHILEPSRHGSTTEVIDIINRNKYGIKILSLFHVTPPTIQQESCIIHLDTEDANKVDGIIAELKNKGYQAQIRAF